VLRTEVYRIRKWFFDSPWRKTTTHGFQRTIHTGKRSGAALTGYAGQARHVKGERASARLFFTQSSVLSTQSCACLSPVLASVLSPVLGFSHSCQAQNRFELGF
jgi:hypothetical protein